MCDSILRLILYKENCTNEINEKNNAGRIGSADKCDGVGWL